MKTKFWNSAFVLILYYVLSKIKDIIWTLVQLSVVWFRNVHASCIYDARYASQSTRYTMYILNCIIYITLYIPDFTSLLPQPTKVLLQTPHSLLRMICCCFLRSWNSSPPTSLYTVLNTSIQLFLNTALTWYKHTFSLSLSLSLPLFLSLSLSLSLSPSLCLPSFPSLFLSLSVSLSLIVHLLLYISVYSYHRL